MEFNSTTFELLRLWPNDDTLKYCTSYTSPSGSIIAEKDHVRVLGVALFNTGNFPEHIRNVVTKVKNLTSWILRSFSCRSAEVMLTLWKSLVLPHLEYASQLWSPLQKGLIQHMEALQWSFLRKIKSSVQNNYWKTLMKFRMYSLERRRERYRIIYLWKIIEELTSNLSSNGEIKLKNNERLGRLYHIKKNILNSQPKILKLRDGSFSVNSVFLFSTIPKPITNLTKCPVEVFKKQLDDFLQTIPDEPQITGMTMYRRANSNSIVDMNSPWIFRYLLYLFNIY